MENTNEKSSNPFVTKPLSESKLKGKINMKQARAFYKKTHRILLAVGLFALLVGGSVTLYIIISSPETVEAKIEAKHKELLPLQAELAKKISEKEGVQSKIYENKKELEKLTASLTNAQSEEDKARDDKNKKQAELDSIINPTSTNGSSEENKGSAEVGK